MSGDGVVYGLGQGEGVAAVPRVVVTQPRPGQVEMQAQRVQGWAHVVALLQQALYEAHKQQVLQEAQQRVVVPTLAGMG